ncbi:uncharacterized protein LOC113069085 [Tachysurus ichikawai]
MSPKLQELLAPQRIRFQHIPPNAPHFGGTWEREVKSVKIALRVILREQVVPEPALQTLLVEVEGILNTKPLGYSKSEVTQAAAARKNSLRWVCWVGLVSVVENLHRTEDDQGWYNFWMPRDG